jgi:hypothetical protein
VASEESQDGQNRVVREENRLCREFTHC